ncbi:MAG: ribosome recycling factor [Gammaproteobacteria bacterium]|nr:ribosome recycling factor [Gammaproteobacteria bacterium]
MIDDILKDAEIRMGKTIEALKNDLSKMRTGRANTSLIEHILVSAYGSDTPLNQVANISVGDARSLTVTPWDKSMVKAIEKAIMDSGLGLNPVTAGEVIRVPLPPLTEERRKEMIRLVRQEVESSRVSIRNVRRDANSDFKSLQKEKEISEDDERRASDLVQKLTDKKIVEIDKLLEDKEKDLMEI